MNLLERIYLSLHERNYARRLRRQKRFSDLRILSIGNLSAGGTGKTPLSMLLAEAALQKKVRTGIALRGYKGSLSSRGVSFEGTESHSYTAKEIGDEALLFSQIPGLRILVGKDRVSLLERYAKDLELVILDDAFQNPLIYHDHELVLLDASLPPSRLRLIPFGKFREPLSALRRAQSILLTRCDQASAESLSFWKNAAIEAAPHLRDAIYQGSHELSGILPEGLPKKLANNPDMPLGLMSGIGNPESFYRTATKALSLGKGDNATKSFDPVISFRDHYLPSLRELEKIYKKYPGHFWLTTEKDWVRFEAQLKLIPGFSKRFFRVQVRMKIHKKQDTFIERLLS